MRASSLRNWTILALGTAAAVALLLAGFDRWNASKEQQLVRAEAESLLAGFDADPGLAPEEYALVTQLSSARAEVRIEAARLAQEQRYASLLEASAEPLAHALIGADLDSTVSTQLVQELICTPLRKAAATANQDVPLYLVPALNPAAFASDDCASILTDRLISADPGTFAEGAQLLALTLDALPPEQARPHIARLVAQVGVAAPGSVDMLFSALQYVDSAAYPEEFTQAVQTLAARITNAAASGEVAALTDAIDFLKQSVAPEELVPVLDAAIDQVLARNNRDLTHALYFTLTDLKLSHPETSFGARADYLMRGINVYSDATEIYDYSSVLRLNEQYPDDDAAIARAVLDGIRNLAPEDYLSGIVPYCKRFLETGAALDYADFLEGARLLVSQIENARFIFQRPCLLDSGFVPRIAVADRAALASFVIDALLRMEGDATRRIAEGVELLGMLTSEAGTEPLARLAALITATVAGDTESHDVLVRAVGGANLAFPADFYPELFVLVANRSEDSLIPPILIDKLPKAQRSLVVSNIVAALSVDLEPDVLAARAGRLLQFNGRFSDEDKAQLRAVLTEALQDPRMIPVHNRLVGAAAGLRIDFDRNNAALQDAWVRHLENSDERAELAPLFRSSRLLGGITSADAAERATVRAAIVRFLGNIVPGDEHIVAVREVLQKPPETPAQPAQRNDRRRATRNPPRILLDMADIENVSGRYITALAGGRPIADFALSIQALAEYSPPGALDNLLYALRLRLDTSADPHSHEILVAAWIAVEKSTNARRTPAERIAQYGAILQFPLTSATSRARLAEEAGKIAEEDFGGNWREVLAWTPAALAASLEE